MNNTLGIIFCIRTRKLNIQKSLRSLQPRLTSTTNGENINHIKS